MKRILMLLLAAALTSVSASGQIDRQLPAYEALRTVGRDKGETWLGHLVEMRAVDGDPQPARWLLTFRDENARGGVREFAVMAQGVVSERTPVRGTDAAAASVMSARTLNLDSTGAFTAVNKQAAQAKVGFQSLDYLLQNQNGAPVWIVRLFDTSRAEMGKIEISAKDGAIVSPLRRPLDATGAATVAATPTPAAPAGSADGSLSERWVEGGGLVGHSKRWGERTWETTTNTAVRVGDSIGAFFTGRPPQQTAPGN
ncbi:MAG: hypothetical protein WEC72_02270 [Chthoniobacterales bacterium]